MFNKEFLTSRRTFLGTMSAGLGILALRGHEIKADAPAHFSHGVASGDPLKDRVILWTRVLPGDGKSRNLKVRWQVAQDEAFSHIVSEGDASVGPARDYCLKVDADGLMPGHHYFYRFIAEGVTSAVGRTRTLPDQDISQVSLAVISCSNYPQGYFNVYRELAGREVEAVLHLGDYIYEYADGIYSNDATVAKGRGVQPKNEVVALEDYRTRYGLYRSDADLQAAHAAHPFICVWDDHEIANNSWKDGAENHNEGEGDYAARKAAAIRAYMEWLPIRETEECKAGKIYRSFDYGTLATLIMLETRICGRDKQLSYEEDLPYRTLAFDMHDEAMPKALLSKEAFAEVPADKINHIPVPFDLRGDKPKPMTDYAEIKKIDPKNLPKGFSYLPDGEAFRKTILGDKNRTIMGTEQESWLAGELEKSKAAGVPWQILGQQLLIGKVPMPMLKDGDLDFEKSSFISKERFKAAQMLAQMKLPFNLDFWDGYPACRDRVFESIKAHANNAVFLAGDTHNAWAFDLADKDGAPVAVEFGTPSVSSPGLEAYIPAEPAVVKAALMASSPELRFLDTEHRGWLELDIRRDAVTANWHYVSTVHEQDYETMAGPSLTTKAGAHKTSHG